MNPETLDRHWLTAQTAWSKVKAKAARFWEKIAVPLALIFMVLVLCIFPWAIWDFVRHPDVRKAMEEGAWKQFLWIIAGYVLTKIWGWIKGVKRERPKVQSSEPQSWGRNHGGIKGRGERHGRDSAV